MRFNMNILNYGGGRQTVAMLVAIKRELIERPDRIVIADTGREKTSTWDYLHEVAQPLAQSIGLTIEIAPRSLAYVDLYGHDDNLLIPAYTKTGKFRTFCSSEWKRAVVNRYFSREGIMPRQRIHWIGFAYDEQRRVKERRKNLRYPLIELMLTKQICQQLILAEGLPLPFSSACWMCPNLSNVEWREIRDHYPKDFERACQVDDEIRAEDMERGNSGVWLHHSRVALRDADLDNEDRKPENRQCSLGMCYV